MDAEAISTLASKLGIAVKSAANFFYDLIPQYVTLRCLQAVRVSMILFIIAACLVIAYCLHQYLNETDDICRENKWRVNDFKWAQFDTQEQIDKFSQQIDKDTEEKCAVVRKKWVKRAVIICGGIFVGFALVTLLACLQYVLAPQAAMVQNILG